MEICFSMAPQFSTEQRITLGDTKKKGTREFKELSLDN